MSGETAARVEAEYQQHRAEVLPRLPEPLRALAQDINIHDGLIRAVAIDATARELRLALVCGDLEAGYCDLDLSYHGVRIDLVDRKVLGVIARDPETEVLYGEVDVWDEGVFVHRLLFWPHYRETDIVFEGLSITCTSRPDRRVEAMSDRYAET
jgi:hypothetical protein